MVWGSAKVKDQDGEIKELRELSWQYGFDCYILEEWSD